MLNAVVSMLVNCLHLEKSKVRIPQLAVGVLPNAVRPIVVKFGEYTVSNSYKLLHPLNASLPMMVNESDNKMLFKR